MKYVEVLQGLMGAFQCGFEGHGILVPHTSNPVTVAIKQANGQVDEKMLVLPTDALLKENNWEGIVALHPACEDILSGQSEVFNLLVRYTKAMVIENSMLILDELARLVASKEKKTSNYIKFAANFPGFDDKVVNDIKSIKNALKNGETKVGDLFTISLDRNEYVDGIQYLRVLYTNSPLFEIDDKDQFLFGAKLSSKARKGAIVNLLKYLMMDEARSYGSNSDAPYFEVLCQFIVDYSKRYNEVVKMFKGDTSLKPVDLKWYDELSNLPKWRKLIPSLEGNIGISTRGNREDEVPFDAEDLRSQSHSSVPDNTPPRTSDRYDERPRDDRGNGTVSLLSLGREEDHYSRRERNQTTGNPREAAYDRRRDDRYRDDRDYRYDDRDRYYDRDYRDRDYRRDDRDYRRDDRDREYHRRPTTEYGTIKPL